MQIFGEMDHAFSALLVVAATALALMYLLLHRNRPSMLQHPPGPKLITAMPTHDAWVEYRNWGREYGSGNFELSIQDRPDQ